MDDRSNVQRTRYDWKIVFSRALTDSVVFRFVDIKIIDRRPVTETLKKHVEELFSVKVSTAEDDK